MPTGIPYVDETLNATVGCTHSGMTGCDNCWAKDLHDIRHKAYLAGKEVPKQYAKPFNVVQLMPERLERVLHRRKPTSYLWCSMSDLFHEDVPISFTCHVLDTIRQTPQHTHLFLTKRPDLMGKHLYGKWGNWQYMSRDTIIPNLWLGISCSTQADLDKMAPTLFQIPAAHYWLSAEPLLENVLIRPRYLNNFSHPSQISKYGWVVVGCESIRGRPGRFCENEKKWWTVARSIVWQCKDAGVAVYVKQGPVNGKVSTNPGDFPEDMRIRELPQ